MRLADHLAAAALRLAPAPRRLWIEAARAELPHVPAREANRFAAGILLSAFRFRLTDPRSVGRSARIGLPVLAALWAGLELRLMLMLHEAGSEPAIIAAVLASAALILAGGLITAWLGLEAAAKLGPAAILTFLAAWLAVDLGFTGSSSLHLVRSLMLENAFAVAMATMAALLARRRERQAEDVT